MIDMAPDLSALASALRPAIGLPGHASDPLSLAQAQFARQRHRVGPLLYKVYSDPDEGNESAAKYVRDCYERNVRRHLRHRAATRKFSAWLAMRGHNSLVVKGWELGDALYDDAALRYSKDIDLLVGPEAMDDALAIAVENGFTIAGKQLPLGRRKAWLLKDRFKEIGVGDPELGVQIELHSRLLHYSPQGWCDPDPVAQDWPVLTNPNYVLYLVIHGASAHWERLKWLCDLALLAQRVNKDVKSEVASRARALGCEAALVAALCVVGQLWDEALVEDWLALTQIPLGDSRVCDHHALIMSRLNQRERPNFARRFLRHSNIVRDTPVFEKPQPIIRATIDTSIFWLASKL